MKKLISLLLISVILLLSVGCNSQEQPSESVSETTGTEVKQIALTTYKVSSDKKKSRTFISANSHWQCQYFEKYLDKTTHIVKAKFLESFDIEWEKVVNFEISEVIRGELIDKTISVIYNPIGYLNNGEHFSTDTIEYKVGNEYLLLLRRVSTPYLDEDVLHPIDDGSLIIPLDANGNADIKQAKIYQQELVNWIGDESLKTAIEDGKFLEKLLEMTKDNPSVANSYGELLNETDLVRIVSGASNVFFIEIKAELEYNGNGNLFYIGDYKCEVFRTVKGDPDVLNGTIELPIDKVEVGKKYLVALDDYGFLVGRNAIFPYTE